MKSCTKLAHYFVEFMIHYYLRIQTVLLKDNIIEPPKKFIHINWRELWNYRDLFLVLAWRDISVRSLGNPSAGNDNGNLYLHF
jgi:hypothetical protein